MFCVLAHIAKSDPVLRLHIQTGYHKHTTQLNLQQKCDKVKAPLADLLVTETRTDYHMESTILQTAFVIGEQCLILSRHQNSDASYKPWYFSCELLLIMGLQS